MANPELLAKLKDVHLPAEVSWWPLAIGWWLLIFLLVAMLVALTVYRLQQAKKYRFSRLALQELAKLENADNKDWLIQLEVLLKRASLAHYPKEQVASLTQEKWLQFLLATGNSIWDDESLLMLKDAVYQNPDKVSLTHKTKILSQSKQWLSQLPQGATNV